MNDDWRLRIDLGERGLARRLGELLAAEEIEHDLKRAFRDRVVVSVDGTEVFCYTDSRAQAQRAEQLIRRLAADHGWWTQTELSHWHATAERWEPADAQQVGAEHEEQIAAERAESEHEEHIAAERAESERQGYPEMEVRVQFPSRGEAADLADRLRAEGIPSLHRFHYVLIGATDDDSAQALARRLREEVGADATVTVEANRRAVYDNRLWSPFAVLGGLGG